jgi:hypothetical protein
MKKLRLKNAQIKSHILVILAAAGSLDFNA